MLRSFVVRIQFVLVFVGVCVGFAVSAADAGAQVFTVNNVNDAGPDSLRTGIEDANDPDLTTNTINFEEDLNGTINLQSNLDPITENVTIDGSVAPDVTVDGTGQDYIFQVDSGKTTLKALKLEGAPLIIGSGATLAFGGSTNQEFAGDITGDGKLVKEDDANLTLRGVSDYTGETLVSGGALIGDTDSLQGDITNNAIVEFNQDEDVDGEYAGVMTGSGAVRKTGADEVRFTGANTYKGGTTISEGSLRGDTGSLQGDIAVEPNGTVIFEEAVDATYEGNLTGDGGLTKEGAGTLTLSGTNTISGESNLNAGALYGDFASIPRGGLVTAVGTSVTFDQDSNGTYAGDLSGDGAFNKLGDGTLTLSGTNTISAASLDAGALQGDFAGILPNLSTAAGTSVIFNHANNGTYAGAISGMADVTKSGGGALTLSGINTFTGLTSITGGRLYVDGSLAGGVDVGANTVLGGDMGSIGGPVTVNGTVAPGKSIGELTVGSVVFESGSVFEVEVNDLGGGAGESDHLVVLGNADLAGGSVEVLPGAGSYLTAVEVTILSAGSRDGEFASLGPEFAFLTITPDYDGASVLLTIERNESGLGQYAETPNQSTIAAALEAARMAPNAGYSEDLETVFESLDVLTVDQVPGALDAMTGETLTQFATARLATAQRFGRALDARIREYQWDANDAIITAGAKTEEASHSTADRVATESGPILGVAMLGVGSMGAPSVGTTANADPLFRTWIDGSGIYGDVDGNSNESAFDYTIWGGSLGADLRLAEHWVLGLAGGYANTELGFSSRPGEGDIDTFQGALYAGYVDPRFHVGVSGRYAYNDMDGKREIGFGLNRTASADPDGDDYGARVESGLNLLDIGGVVLQPTVSLDYNRLTQDDVTESGAGSLNLAIEDNDLDSLALGVGMRVHGHWKIAEDLWIVPELHGRWLHEFLDTDRLIEAQLVGGPVGGSAFQIQGVELPRDSGSVGVAWSVITRSAWSITGSYDAILNEDLVQHVGSITLSFEF
jgi:autotransporter-associated beta strand protein